MDDRITGKEILALFFTGILFCLIAGGGLAYIYYAYSPADACSQIKCEDGGKDNAKN